MPEFRNWVIFLINQSKEIGENQLSDFDSTGGQISPLMHVPLWWTGSTQEDRNNVPTDKTS